MSVIDISKITKESNVLGIISEDYPAYQSIVDTLKSAAKSFDTTARLGTPYDLVILVTGAPVDRPVLPAYFHLLKSGGQLNIYQSSADDLTIDLFVNGFVDVSTTQYNGLNLTVASRPDWGSGVAESVQIPTAPSAGWGSLESTETINENDLLSENDKNVKPANDCEVGAKGKKACKNCSCGRAEMEENGTAPVQKLTKEMIENPGVNSSCGSVMLLDAEDVHIEDYPRSKLEKRLYYQMIF
eukprot:gene15134-17913_t